MSKQFNLKNFYKMTGGFVNVPIDQTDMLHKSIINFMPSYSLLNSETSDTNIYKKIDPSFPLVATKVTSLMNFSSVPSAIIPSRAAGNSFLAIGSDGKYVDSSGSTLKDFASSYVTTFNETADIQTVFDKIFISCSNQDYVYYCNFDGTGANRTSGFSAYGSEIPKPMVVFLNGLYIIGGTNGNTLYKIDSTLAKSTIATIQNHTIRHGVNYNDRYLVYFASLSQEAQPDGTDWYMLFHDGSTNGNFQYRTKINGQFVAHAQVGDLHYVFHEDGSNLVCSYINGYSLTEVSRVKNITKSYPTASNLTGVCYRNKATVVQDYVFIPTKYLGDSVLLSWNVKTGETALVHKNNSFYPRLVVSNTYSGTPVVQVFDGGSAIGSNIISPTGTVGSFEYESNYLRFGDRVKISRVDIVMDDTFPTTGDKITFTINYQDKLNSASFEQFAKTDITTGFSDSTVLIDSTRVIINDIGIVGTDFSFDLLGTVATASWDLVIREFIIYYEEVGQLS
jgi:hypothetical protein